MPAKTMHSTFVLTPTGRPTFLGTWLEALVRFYRTAQTRCFFYDAERAKVMAERHAERLAARYPPPFRF